VLFKQQYYYSLLFLRMGSQRKTTSSGTLTDHFGLLLFLFSIFYSRRLHRKLLFQTPVLRF
jgi:hypothetical protein